MIRGRWLAREAGVLAVLGLVAAAGAYALRTQRVLKQENERLTRLLEPHPGVYVPEISLASTHGDSVILGQVGRRQLLFFFNTTCPHCRASLPAWNRIAEAVETDDALDVLGVAFDDRGPAEAYVEQQGIRFTVVSGADARVAGLYRITGVPTVVLIHPSGRMAYARLGPLEAPAAVDSVLAAIRGTDSADLPEGGGH